MVNIFPKITVPKITIPKIKIGFGGSKREDKEWMSTQPIAKTTGAVMQILASVPRMTHCRPNLIKHSIPKFALRDGTVVRTWTSPFFRDDYVFLADSDGKMIFGGFVWLYKDQLKDAIELIRRSFT
ncbi:MAG: hypothetical protein ACHBN1_32770 [Heteroscytonema crispum UTEX LB 1556]